MQNLTPEKSKALVYLIVGIAVVVLAFIVIKKFFGGFDSVLESLGLKSDPEELEAKKHNEENRDKSSLPGSPWSPSYYRYIPAGSLLFRRENALKLAREIFAGIGFFYDTPSQIYGAIKQCETKAQVSQVCDVFAETYKRDLYNYITIGLDTGEQLRTLEQINIYVNNLPNY